MEGLPSLLLMSDIMLVLAVSLSRAMACLLLVLLMYLEIRLVSSSSIKLSVLMGITFLIDARKVVFPSTYLPN
jgi:hypothetical protein